MYVDLVCWIKFHASNLGTVRGGPPNKYKENDRQTYSWAHSPNLCLFNLTSLLSCSFTLLSWSACALRVEFAAAGGIVMAATCCSIDWILLLYFVVKLLHNSLYLINPPTFSALRKMIDVAYVICKIESCTASDPRSATLSFLSVLCLFRTKV